MKIRTKARAWALQILYACDMRGTAEPLEDLEADLARSGLTPLQSDSRAYAHTLLAVVQAHRREIDARIETLATNWRLARMTAIDRNILRLAAAEMLYVDEIPLRVSVHEAIRLAEWFGTAESSRFINGILDALLRELESERVPSEERLPNAP